MAFPALLNCPSVRFLRLVLVLPSRILGFNPKETFGAWKCEVHLILSTNQNALTAT